MHIRLNIDQAWSASNLYAKVISRIALAAEIKGQLSAHETLVLKVPGAKGDKVKCELQVASCKLRVAKANIISQLDWLQSLKLFFINVSYHILLASLTLMALF